ncbi:IclR family transcriptional regulator C-terminal domain-containing protein [Streptomyces sp. NPDC048192]|uniref:IclR family transcriptional regulator domain-containing protein n=1 Tax=Streptomyces sp. NPDC048192 TaxID=3365510 RepID=UPI003722EA45
MVSEKPEPGDQYVQSLARGLSVIMAFDAQHREMTLSEVAARTGLSRATVRRLLLTLAELGFVRVLDNRFTLTPRILRLGTAYLSGLELPQIVQPHLERLSAQLGESTSLAVLDGTDIVYVARVATRRIMTVGITVGTRFPAFATAMGRVLLSALPASGLDDYFTRADLTPPTPRAVHDEASLRQILTTTRVQGWAYVEEELERGLCSLAAPVVNGSGDVVAAVNVSTTTQHDESTVDRYRQALLATAADISEDAAAAGVRP